MICMVSPECTGSINRSQQLGTKNCFAANPSILPRQKSYICSVNMFMIFYWNHIVPVFAVPLHNYYTAFLSSPEAIDCR